MTRRSIQIQARNKTQTDYLSEKYHPVLGLACMVSTVPIRIYPDLEDFIVWHWPQCNKTDTGIHGEDSVALLC